MITFFVICAHLLLNVWIGWVFLTFFPDNRNWAESLVASLLLGIYLETLLIASMLFIGVSIKISVILMTGGILLLTFVAWLKGNITMPKFSLGKLKWYEWILLFSIVEKIMFGLWKIIQTPLFFDDALTQWSGRARSLFGSVNFSLNPESPVFLGIIESKKHYPFAIQVWRMVTAIFNGSWNDTIGRVDGLVFFIAIISTVWLIVWRFSKIRWLATLAAFIVSALPLQIWHAAAGYGDIAVGAFAVASLASLLRQEWFLAGIFAAGAAWTKNDGLILYMPGIFVMVFLLQFSLKEIREFKWFQKEKWQKIILFMAGLITLIPWFIFKYIHALGVTPNQEKLSFHPEALGLFWKYVVNGSSHSIFWLFISVSILLILSKMYRDNTGRALLGLFLTSFLAIAFVYSCTDAYRFLLDETGVHRSMLQFYGVAIVVVIYGIWLKISDFSLN